MMVTLSGCGGVTLTLPYQPVTTAEVKGNVEVETFKYYPKDGFAQNQVRNTALGKLYLTENVDDFITNAVRRELRQATLSLKQGAKCKLQGEINDFALDDLGYSVTYISNIHYTLSDNSGTALYDNIVDVNFKTSKFLVAQAVFANVNKAISDNVDKFINDPVLQKAIADKCQ